MSIKQLSFKDLFTAENISEPLASVSSDENDLAKEYFDVMNYDVIGYKEDNIVIGYLEKVKTIDHNNLNNSMINFSVSDLITNNTSLIECLRLLQKRTRLFVINKSEVESIVTISDIQKPAVRMLYFGIVTFFESLLADLINEIYPMGNWKTLINESRVNKAQQTFNELINANSETNLINCTQLCDKTDIVCNTNELLNEFVHLSKNKAKKFFKRINSLRNDLAHAQSLTEWFEKENVIQLIDDLFNITERIINRKKGVVLID